MAEEHLSPEGEQKKKKKGLLKWIIIGVLLAALAGGGWFAYLKFFAKSPDEAAGPSTAPGQAEAVKPKADVEGVIVTLPSFLVNLADPLGRRYLKLGLDVEVKDNDARKELDRAQAKIKDKMLLLLSSKTYEGLSTVEDKIKLKQEIVDRLNQVVGNGKVLRVYITEMVIQ
ncbi:MAG: flagellar basal body-associated FliL family protein [Desulfovibrionaceae bacterium]|nr:flagellar basal body-associated FliL family protein [Desulfovibrionaceae bacterium]